MSERITRTAAQWQNIADELTRWNDEETDVEDRAGLQATADLVSSAISDIVPDDDVTIIVDPGAADWIDLVDRTTVDTP